MLMDYLQILPTMLRDAPLMLPIEYLIDPVSLLTVDIIGDTMDAIEDLTCWHFFELITLLGIPPVPATFFMLILEDVYGFVSFLLTAGYGRLINTLVYVIDLLFTTYAFISDAFFLLENTISHATNSIVANAVSTALKFLLCVCFLIFARGGIPRYRFDYLTRLG